MTEPAISRAEQLMDALIVGGHVVPRIQPGGEFRYALGTEPDPNDPLYDIWHFLKSLNMPAAPDQGAT